ncbi:MAG: response regulator [Nitrospirae bacterium]|nr:response regulator [Nitrospirota bacterium]
MLNILMIEDDREDAELIMARLSSPMKINSKVTVAGRLCEGLELLKAGSFELVLLDLGLPDCRGIETYKKLCAEFPYMPVIVLSGLDDETIATEAVKHGAQDYLVKGSINSDMLIRCIRYAIERHEIRMAGLKHIERRKRAEEELKELNRILETRVAGEVEKHRQKEQLLIQQSKMAAMGEMIGNIAHQWKQPLNALGIIIGDILDAYDFGELDRTYLEEIVDQSREQISFMSKTIDDFRNFLKPSKAKTNFDVKIAVAEVLSILWPQFRTNFISFVINCNNHNKTFNNLSDVICCNDMIISTYKNEFAQVILNIITNAKDAIIESRENGYMNKADEGIIIIDCARKPDSVLITIRDNGGGIPDGIMDRIFEPYFTTKSDDKGTGIGLYMAKTIIENNLYGTLTARNVDGGAEFTITVPAKTQT